MKQVPRDNQGRIQDFVLGGGESRREVWGPLKVSSRSMAKGAPGVEAPPPPPPRKLLGFEYLGSFSVNNFEAFCECDEVY